MMWWAIESQAAILYALLVTLLSCRFSIEGSWQVQTFTHSAVQSIVGVRKIWLWCTVMCNDCNSCIFQKVMATLHSSETFTSSKWSPIENVYTDLMENLCCFSEFLNNLSSNKDLAWRIHQKKNEHTNMASWTKCLSHMLEVGAVEGASCGSKWAYQMYQVAH